MNFSEIKTEAKNKMKGHFWEIFGPFAILIGINLLLGTITGKSYDEETFNVFSLSLDTLAGFFTSIIGMVYSCYLLNFIRTGKTDFDSFFEIIKNKWVLFLVISILIGVFTTLWSLLLIIPGIIAALSYSQAKFIGYDNELQGYDCIKKSKEMMKGYKWNYFLFNLSFIGWYILGIFTFGILYIWVIPYVEISTALYYEKLKENNNTSNEAKTE